MPYDYQGALDAGYTEQEIEEYLLKENPHFDMQAARQAGYTNKEITEFLSSEKKEPENETSNENKITRGAAQLGLGIAQGTPIGIATDISSMFVESEGARIARNREHIAQEIEDLYEKKYAGEWSEEDEKKLKELREIGTSPDKLKETTPKALNLGVRGIAEKITGTDLHPKGVFEKALTWLGFLRSPQKGAIQRVVTPSSLKEFYKAAIPTGTEVVRSAAAGTALEMAEEGQFGPMGTMAVAVMADVAGHAPGIAVKAALNPKKTAAQVVNLATMNNTKRQIASQLAENFEKSNLTIDAGTLTQSPLVQMIQARLSQSGLTGTALEDLRKELVTKVYREYENVIDHLGQLKFENNFQASEALKEALQVEEQNLRVLSKEAGPSPAKKSLEAQAKEAQELQKQSHIKAVEDEFLNDIAPEPLKSTAQKGEELKFAANEVRDELKQKFNERYAELDSEISNIEAGPQITLANELEEFIESNSHSLSLGESTAESSVLNTAKRLLKKLKTKEGEYIGVTLESLHKTKRTLQDLANYEFHGSNFESAYKKLASDVGKAIDEALEEYPQLRNKYHELSADYSKFKDIYESKNLKHLYEPKNNNYNAIYNEILRDPDKIRTLEKALGGFGISEDLVDMVKRDYTANHIKGKKPSGQEIRDLQSVLGAKHNNQLLDFIARRLKAEEPILRPPTPPKAKELPVRPELPPSGARPKLSPSRVSETSVPRAAQGVRKKMLEKLKSKDGAFKSSDQIMQQMDSIEGIRQLRKALTTTPEGKKLFDELSRFKLAQLIDNHILQSVTGDISLGKFSGLLKPSKTREIVKELVGKEAFEKLSNLQRNAGHLAESASKFFNASKSGVTVGDVGQISTAVIGLFTGNPFIIVSALSYMGGNYALAKLLGDKVFLRELEKAIKTNNPKKFMTAMENMAPIVANAMGKTEEE